MTPIFRILAALLVFSAWALTARAQEPLTRDVQLASAPTPSASGRRIALLIGVDRYDDPGIRDLQFAASDARELRRALIESGSFLGKDVVLMTPDQPDPALRPTRANVLKQFAALESAEPTDLVFVYFSGHGTAADTDSGRHNYIYPQDTVPVVLEDTGIEVDELLLRVERSKANGQVVVFDACRGDPSASKSVEQGGFAAERYDSRGMKILFSAEFGQPSYEDPARGQGAFTVHLLEALEGRADGFEGSGPQDGVISMAEVYAYARARMVSGGDGVPPQRPVLAGELSGLDLALVEARSDLPPVACPSTSVALTEALDGATASCTQPDSVAYLNGWRQARDVLRCVAEPVSPVQAARWHALSALRASAQSNQAEAAAELRAARLLEQRHQLPDSLPPACAPTAAQETAASLIPLSERATGPLPAGARLLVDGTAATTLTNELPAVIQFQWSREEVKAPLLRRPGEAPPDFTALVPPDVVRQRRQARTLALSAGGAALAAGGLLWAGLDARATLEDRADTLNQGAGGDGDVDPTAGQAEIEAGARRVNALGVGAGAAALVGLGLCGVALTVRF